MFGKIFKTARYMDMPFFVLSAQVTQNESDYRMWLKTTVEPRSLLKKLTKRIILNARPEDQLAVIGLFQLLVRSLDNDEGTQIDISSQCLLLRTFESSRFSFMP